MGAIAEKYYRAEMTLVTQNFDYVTSTVTRGWISTSFPGSLYQVQTQWEQRLSLLSDSSARTWANPKLTDVHIVLSELDFY